MSHRRKPGRPKNEIPTVDVHVYLPIHIANAMDALLVDPVYQRPNYGARAKYITELIIKDLREKKYLVQLPKGDIHAADEPPVQQNN